MKLRFTAAALAALASVALVAGCSSASSSSPSGSSVTSSSTSSDPQNSGLKAAQAVLTAGERGGAVDSNGDILPAGQLAQDKLGPVKVKPGTKMFFISCAETTAGCDLNLQEMKQVAAATKSVLNYCVNPDGSVQNDQACMEQGIQDHPGFIVVNSVAVSDIANQLKAAHAAGIPVIDQYGQSVPTPGEYAGSSGYGDAVVAGEWLAAGITAESQGHANVLYVGSTNYPVDLQDRGGGVKEGLQKYCGSGCTIDYLKYDITQLAQLPSQIEGYLQSHPNINWVVGGLSIAGTYAVNQVRQAGKTGSISVATFDQDPANKPALVSGSILKFDMGTAENMNAWSSADLGFRLIAGQKTNTSSDGLIILTPNSAKLDPWPGPTGFEDAFKRLWGVQ